LKTRKREKILGSNAFKQHTHARQCESF